MNTFVCIAATLSTKVSPSYFWSLPAQNESGATLTYSCRLDWKHDATHYLLGEKLSRMHEGAPRAAEGDISSLGLFSKLMLCINYFRCRLFSLLYLKCTTIQEDKQRKPLSRLKSTEITTTNGLVSRQCDLGWGGGMDIKFDEFTTIVRKCFSHLNNKHHPHHKFCTTDAFMKWSHLFFHVLL